jgi:hypothetical protein
MEIVQVSLVAEAQPDHEAKVLAPEVLGAVSVTEVPEL